MRPSHLVKPSSLNGQKLNTGISFPNTMRPTEKFVPPLIKSDTWLNSNPLTSAMLKGKVRLVYFFSIGEPDALSEIPHLNWLHKKLGGTIAIVGVHVPKFENDEVVENVRRAVKSLEIEFPVALDNQMKVWRTYRNQYWGQVHLLDGEGVVRDYHAGQDIEDEVEEDLLFLLSEQGKEVDLRPRTGEIEVEGDWYLAEGYVEHTSNEKDEISIRYVGKSLAIGIESSAQTHVQVTMDGKPVPKASAGDDLEIMKDGCFLKAGKHQHHHVIKEDLDRMHEVAFIFRVKGVKVTGFFT